MGQKQQDKTSTSRPKNDKRSVIYSTLSRQNNPQSTLIHVRLQKYLQSNFNLDATTMKNYQRLCLLMIKKKVVPASLDELKFSFLELADTETVDVSVDELRSLVKKYVDSAAEAFAEKFVECLGGGDDGADRVSYDKL